MFDIYQTIILQKQNTNESLLDVHFYVIDSIKQLVVNIHNCKTTYEIVYLFLNFIELVMNLPQNAFGLLSCFW